MKKFFKRNFWKADGGSAAIESVFIIPFMCVVFFGSQDLISLITFNKKLIEVSVAVSDSVAQYKNTITRAQVSDIENIIALIVAASQVDNVQVDVYSYYMNGNTVTKRWSTKSPKSTVCAAPVTSNYANMMLPGNDVIVAVSCMKYTPWVGTFMGGQNLLGSSSFTLTQALAAVPYQSKAVNCVTASGGSTVCNE